MVFESVLKKEGAKNQACFRPTFLWENVIDRLIEIYLGLTQTVRAEFIEAYCKIKMPFDRLMTNRSLSNISRKSCYLSKPRSTA